MSESYLLRASEKAKEEGVLGCWDAVLDDGTQYYGGLITQLVNNTHPADYPILLALFELAAETLKKDMPSAGVATAATLREHMAAVVVAGGVGRKKL